MQAITVKDFIDQVAIVRDAQKRYFATRAKGALVESKEAEKKLDKMLELIKDSSLYNAITSELYLFA